MDVAGKIIDFEQEEIDDDHHYLRGAVHVSTLLLLIMLVFWYGSFLGAAIAMVPVLLFEYLWWRVRIHNAEEEHVGRFGHFWEQLAG